MQGGMSDVVMSDMQMNDLGIDNSNWIDPQLSDLALMIVDAM
jgi:hypothetical protein